MFACHSALHSLMVFCWAKAAGAAQSIAISMAQRIPANRGFIFRYLVLEKVGGPAIGPLSFFLAFFHEAVFGRSRKRLAIFVDRLRLTGIPDTFCHEATQRGAGKRFAVLPNRLASTTVLCCRYSYYGSECKSRYQDSKKASSSCASPQSHLNEQGSSAIEPIWP